MCKSCEDSKDSGRKCPSCGQKITKREFPKKPGEWIVPGKKVFIRTVTHYHVGIVSAADDESIELVEAAWVADTGHFGKAMNDGKFAEVCYYPADMPVLVNRGAIVDCCPFVGDHRDCLRKPL